MSGDLWLVSIMLIVVWGLVVPYVGEIVRDPWLTRWERVLHSMYYLMIAFGISAAVIVMHHNYAQQLAGG